MHVSNSSPAVVYTLQLYRLLYFGIQTYSSRHRHVSAKPKAPLSSLLCVATHLHPTRTPHASAQWHAAASSYLLRPTHLLHGARVDALGVQLESLKQDVRTYQCKELVLSEFLSKLSAVLPNLHPTSLEILVPIVQGFAVRYQAPPQTTDI